MITLVTSRCYLNCESINSIIMQLDYDRVTTNRVIKSYQIVISFAQTSNSGGSSEDAVLYIKVHGHKYAQALFKEIVVQLREQLPDQMYLDKMMENILSGEKDFDDDIGTEALSSIRKEKGGNKNVLRAASRSRKKRSR